jgi:hypothetical protein
MICDDSGYEPIRVRGESDTISYDERNVTTERTNATD